MANRRQEKKQREIIRREGGLMGSKTTRRGRKARATQGGRQGMASVKSTLFAAGRAARSLGLKVGFSKDRQGYISSCYVTDGKIRVRISDHQIPMTRSREDGGGWQGAEVIVERPVSPSVWHRYLRMKFGEMKR